MAKTISFPICFMILVVALFFGACSHPVDESWLDKASKDFHGTSDLLCEICHDLEADCSGCHFGSSGNNSPSDWIHGTTPHEELESSGPVCNSCHEFNRSYGNGPDTCHDCHGLSALHETGEDLLNKTSSDFHGSSDLTCIDCHDLAADCSGCHFGSSGNKSPSDWVHGTTPHGQFVVNGPVCNSCHDLNRSLGKGPDTCHDCHGLPVSHATGEPWLNKGNPDFHGSSELTCIDCHDLVDDCSGCHFGSSGNKSPSGWVHGTTPHEEVVASETVCNSCHELNRGYGNGPEACHDCHSLPVSHATGELWLNKSNPDFHGSSELTCIDCHDLVADCNECHFGSTGDKSPSGWAHGTIPHEEVGASETVCNSCHELNRGYGNGPEVCHDCHGLPVSHETGEPWLNKSNPDFHGSSELTCIDCHDLVADCSECHFGPSGDKSPSDWEHAKMPHKQVESSGPVCNSCHTLNRNYGNGPDACHDCHED